MSDVAAQQQLAGLSQHLTMRNLGTVGLIVIGVVGGDLAYRHRSHPKLAKAVEKTIAVLRAYPMIPGAVVVGWLYLRYITAVGLFLTIEGAVVVCVLMYLLRRQKKLEQDVAMRVQQVISQPDQCVAILGSRLPAWISFPNVQRATWLNTIIAGLWPYVVKATEKDLKQRLGGIMAAHKPVFLTKLELGKANLGPIPISVDGFQHHSATDTETVLDIHISWRSEADFRVVAAVSPLVEVEAVVDEVRLQMVVRLCLGPHFNTFPCIEALAYSIIGVPDVTFRLRAAKVPLDAIPGLSGWIDGFIRKVLIGQLAYPLKKVIPLVAASALSAGSSGALDNRANPLGSLSIEVHSVNNIQSGFLPTMMFMPSQNIQVKLGFVGADEKRKRTPVVDAKGKPLSAVYTKENVFKWTLYERTSVLGLWVYEDSAIPGNFVTGPKLLGEAKLLLSDLTSGTGDMKRVAVPCVLLTQDGPCMLTVTVSSKYRAFTEAKAGGGTSSSSASFGGGAASGDMSSIASPPHAPPTRTASSARTPVSRAPNNNSDGSLQPSETMSLAESIRNNIIQHVTLFAIIERCTGLRNMEKAGTSDPYVVLSVGSSRIKTAVVKSNLNPVYDFAGELDVDRVDTAVLRIAVYDHNLTRDVLMGEGLVNLSDVIQSNGRLRSDFALRPQGTITLNLKLRALE